MMSAKRKRQIGRYMVTVLLTGTLTAGTISSISASTESGQVALDEESNPPESSLKQIDNTKWLYNSDDDVYYQLGIVYCETPADADQEQLSVIVPGAYMTAQDNGDGTYTCDLYEDATVNGYTALRDGSESCHSVYSV